MLAFYSFDDVNNRFNECWNSWKEDDYQQNESSIIKSSKISIGEHPVKYVITKLNSEPQQFWSYGIIYDSITSKEAMVSMYSIDEEKYFQDFMEILENIRFEK